METDRVGLKIFLACVAAVIAVEAVVGTLIPDEKAWRLIIVGIARLLQTGMILFIVVRWGKGWPSVGLGRTTLVRGIQKGAIWSGAFGFCALTSGLIWFLIGGHPLDYISFELPQPVREIGLLFFIGGGIGPVAEEIFFRGICYGFFRKWGVVVAMGLTTAVFVLAHVIKSGIPVPQMVGGLVFALAYEKEGNLLTPIMIHISGNLALFAISIWF